MIGHAGRARPTLPTRAIRGIHAQNCHCPRCMHHAAVRADPRERTIRAIMFAAALLIGGALGHAVTPQDLAAEIRATVAGAVP